MESKENIRKWWHPLRRFPPEELWQPRIQIICDLSSGNSDQIAQAFLDPLVPISSHADAFCLAVFCHQWIDRVNVKVNGTGSISTCDQRSIRIGCPGVLHRSTVFADTSIPTVPARSRSAPLRLGAQRPWPNRRSASDHHPDFLRSIEFGSSVPVALLCKGCASSAAQDDAVHKTGREGGERGEEKCPQAGF